MRITHFFVNGYKNLRDCDLFPNGIHVITGCNAVGKSNLLESIILISNFMTSSEQERDYILDGWSLSGSTWIPFGVKSQISPEFVLEGEILKSDEIWEFTYLLKFSEPQLKDKSYYTTKEPMVVSEEFLKIKVKGKPGKQRTIFSRDRYGNTSISPELNKRTISKLQVLENSAVLASLKVIEASSFENKFPVTSSILKGISELKTISLSPKLLIDYNQRYPISKGRLNSIRSENRNTITVVNLFSNISRIKADDFLYEKFTYWAEKILRITNIHHEIKIQSDNSHEDSEEVRELLWFKQDGKLLFSKELSSGSIVLLALLTIILDPDFSDRSILIEEPEAYLHPKAIADFITLIKSISANNTIIISTHNPVVLNSMNIDEVTLINFDDNNMAHTIPVSKISQATKSLDRGFVNFGDLLQNNFLIEDEL